MSQNCECCVEQATGFYIIYSNAEIFIFYSPFCRIDDPKELEDLSIGDKIIEVNGVTVKDRHLDEITSLLENTSEALHLMVERDPSPLPRDRGSSLYSSDTETESDSSAVASPEAVDVDGTKVLLRPKDVIKTNR